MPMFASDVHGFILLVLGQNGKPTRSFPTVGEAKIHIYNCTHEALQDEYVKRMVRCVNTSGADGLLCLHCERLYVGWDAWFHHVNLCLNTFKILDEMIQVRLQEERNHARLQ